MKKYTNYIVFLLVLCVTILYVRSYIYGIFGGLSNQLILPNEFGQYSAEAKKYSKENIKLIDTLEVGKEPGLFLMTSDLNRIANISPPSAVIFMAILCYILTTNVIYVFIRNVSKKTTGFVTVILIIFSFLSTASLILLATRQALCHIFLLLMCLSWEYHYNNKKILLVSIFFAMAVLSHRVGIMFSALSLFGVLGYFLIKKDRGGIKYTIKVISFGLLLSAPFLFMQIGDIIISIESYIWKIQGGTLDVDNVTKSFQDASEDGGWDFFTSSSTIKHTPIIHYFIYEAIILIPLIANFKKGILYYGNKNKLAQALLWILCIYESFSLIFGTRILATLEIILLPLAGIILLQYKNNILKILTICSFILLNTFLSSKNIQTSQIINIKNDKSIEFIRKNISPDSVLLGHPWVADIGNQLGYITGNNIAFAPLYIPIYGAIIGTYNGNNKPISLYTTRVMAKNMGISLAFQPEVHEVFKGHNMYILIVRGMEKNLFKKYNNKYFSSEYLNLIYENKTGNTYFSYIFKVNMEKIIYYDGRAYFHNNFLKDYN